MRRAIIISFILLTVIGAAGLGTGYVLLERAYKAAGPSRADAVVNIPKGISVAGIAARLASAGVLRDARVFRYGHRVFDDKRPLRAGEYRFPAGISAAGAARVLKEAEQVFYKITLAEGLTSAEAVALLRNDPVLDGMLDTTPDEGTLLPETYHFHRGTTRAEMVRRMQVAMDKVLDKLWPARTGDLPIKSRHAAVTLASIVEKETAVPDERPHIAGVFVNRLQKRIRLQSDPTVVYGITNGAGPLERALTRDDLKQETAYNTYVIDALPPGPIANPGRASLEAVMHPLETGDIYFVADGSGGHAFAKTLEQHNRNVRKWRKLQNEK